MKIICDSCSARYSIADDKIAGRSFKIRCKKCSGVIVVRGTQAPRADAEAPRVIEERPEAIWHVAMEGSEQGPYSAAQLGEMAEAQRIDRDVYVWREGFDDWCLAGEVPALAAVMGGAAGTDIFAREHNGPSPFEGGGDEEPESASQPSPSAAVPAVTGQRNESSVLFSLQNLRGLAASKGETSTPGTPATGEASGLIDIRALATSANLPRASSAQSADPDRVDDLLRIGTGSPLGSSLGGPVLVPVVEEKRDRTLVIAVAAVSGVVALAAAAVIGVLLTQPAPVAASPGPSAGSGPITPALTAGPTAAAPAPEAIPVPGAAMDEPAVEAPSPGPASTPEAAQQETPSVSDEAERRNGRRDRRRARPRQEPALAGAEPPPPGPRTIEELLDLGAPMETRNTLPDTPARGNVASALRSVRAAVNSCGNGQHGTANTTVTVSGSNGRVANVRVTGQFAGTPVGSCVARAVRGARFSRFQQRTFEVSFPYRI